MYYLHVNDMHNVIMDSTIIIINNYRYTLQISRMPELFRRKCKYLYFFKLTAVIGIKT